MTREYTLPPLPTSVADARRHVRETLADHTDVEVLGQVELVVSELVTNAVRHGPGSHPVTLRLGVEDGVITGEVEDEGDGAIEMGNHEPGTIVGGLGLPIVDEIVSDWGVYPGSTHVWFRLDPAQASLQESG